MNESKVMVSAKDGGPVVVVSEHNPEYAYVRVIQERMVTTPEGWIKPKVLTALVHGTTEDLQKLGWKAGQEIKGKIVVKHSLVPFNAKDPQRDLKIAGKTGIVCTKDGQPIYYKTVFSFDSEMPDDAIIEHSNKDEITRAHNALEVDSSKSLAE